MHQTEALIGILLESKDSRAKTLLEDLSEVRFLTHVLFLRIPLVLSSCRTKMCQTTYGRGPSIFVIHSNDVLAPLVGDPYSFYAVPITSGT